MLENKIKINVFATFQTATCAGHDAPTSIKKVPRTPRAPPRIPKVALENPNGHFRDSLGTLQEPRYAPRTPPDPPKTPQGSPKNPSRPPRTPPNSPQGPLKRSQMMSKDFFLQPVPASVARIESKTSEDENLKSRDLPGEERQTQKHSYDHSPSFKKLGIQ